MSPVPRWFRAAAPFVAALLMVSGATVGGCKCNKTAPSNMTPVPPPEPNTPTPWPTSSILHSHAYVSQMGSGNVYFATILTTTPTPTIAFTTTAIPALGGLPGPSDILASSDDGNTLVEVRTGSTNMAVFDLTSNPVNPAFATVPTNPNLSAIYAAKFAPPQGRFSNYLFLANQTPVASNIQAYKFSGTGVTDEQSFTFLGDSSNGAGVITDFAFTPDGNRLAILSGGEVAVYDITTNPWSRTKDKISVDTSSGGSGASIAIHANDWLVYVAISTGNLLWANLYTGESGTAVTSAPIIKLLADPAGRWLFGLDNTQEMVHVFDTTVTPPVEVTPICMPGACPGGGDNLWDIDYSPARQWLLATDLVASPPTAWLLNLTPYNASNGATPPNAYTWADVGAGQPASHCRFGK